MLELQHSKVLVNARASRSLLTRPIPVFHNEQSFFSVNEYRGGGKKKYDCPSYNCLACHVATINAQKQGN